MAATTLTPIELAVQIVTLVEHARTMPPSRELALVITKLQEAYLWVSELQAVQDGASDLKPGAGT